MSILLIDKKSALSKQLSISSQFLNTPILKKFASVQLNCHPSQLKLYHIGMDKEYGQNQIVRQGDKIQYLLQSKGENPTLIENRKKGIVYSDQLQKIIQNSKIIVIKSANQENIQKSKQHSLWATTFSNQERLKYFFNSSPHVLLMFATNRSFEIKGLARMESQPDKITDKSVWAGVSNIRLGGNFRIKWLRKKPLSLVAVEKYLGSNFKQTIIKSCDGQQLDPISCKKLANLFETPDEPYYQADQINPTSYSKEKEKLNAGTQALFKFPMLHQMKFPPVPQTQNFQVQVLSSSKNQKHKSQSSSESSSSEFQKKKKKIKKQRKKKSKKHKKDKKSLKKYQSSSSSSSESPSSDSSEESSESMERRKRSKKSKRQKKHKKHRS